MGVLNEQAEEVVGTVLDTPTKWLVVGKKHWWITSGRYKKAFVKEAVRRNLIDWRGSVFGQWPYSATQEPLGGAVDVRMDDQGNVVEVRDQVGEKWKVMIKPMK